jgi:hypothetical protein
MDYNIVIIALLSLVIILEIVSFILTSSRDRLLSQAYESINDFVQVSLAYQASRDVHPVTGPAVLQRLAELRKTPEAPQETLQGTDEKKSGVTMKMGIK